MLKASNFFYYHNYYIIPFVPVMAVVAGFAIAEIAGKRIALAIFLLSAGVAEAVLNQQHGFFLPKEEMYKLSLT